MPAFHTIALGEVLLEFTRRENDVWSTTPSGDVLNTLFYLSREECRTGLATRFGDDPFLSEVMHTLDSEEIDHSLCSVDPAHSNGIYFVSADVTGERSFHYRRSDSAARRLFETLDVDALINRLVDTKFFLVTGISLAILHDRAKLVDLLHRTSSESDVTILFDPNIRASLWESTEEARLWVERVLPVVDIFLPSDADLAFLWGESSDRAELFRRLDLDHVVLTQGEKETELWLGGQRTTHPVRPTDYVRDTTGAGDAFNAGYIAGLGRGLSPAAAVRAGQDLAARVVGVKGAIDRTYRASPERR